MKIHVLMENTAGRPDMLTEHGLSLYVETKRHKLLFDTGQSPAFAENARRLGIDLSQVDLAVISHGHYDHGGGLARFLELNHTAPVYLNCHAFEPHGHKDRYIGIDRELAKNPRLIPVNDALVIDEELELYSCNERAKPYGLDSAGLSMYQDGKWIPEDFRHEQYLLIWENNRTVLLSGCSHKGILNIQTWFQPDVLIGGFHFAKLDPEGDGRQRLEEAAAILQQFPTRYWTGHCTGVPQYQFLKKQLGYQLGYLGTGQVLYL